MLQGHTTAIVPCGNPTPKKLPTGGGEWPTFRTARAQRTVRPLKPYGYWSWSVPDSASGQHHIERLVNAIRITAPPLLKKGSFDATLTLD